MWEGEKGKGLANQTGTAVRQRMQKGESFDFFSAAYSRYAVEKKGKVHVWYRNEGGDDGHSLTWGKAENFT